MPNFFSRFKRKNIEMEEATDGEAEAVKPFTAPDSLVDNTSVLEKTKFPDFSASLENLRQIIDLKKNLGSQTSPEEVEQATGVSLEKLAEFIEKEPIDIETTGGRFIEAVQLALTTAENNQKSGGLMRVLANNPTVRAALVSLMIFTKFSPEAKAAEKSTADKDEPKKEANKPAGSQVVSANTYQLNIEDIRRTEKNLPVESKSLESRFGEAGRLAFLAMENHFDTDSDQIPEIEKEKIASDFEKFLEKINSDNIQDVLKSEFKLYGSSDERPTNNWQGSNTNLTKARLLAAKKVLQDVLQNYNCKDLSQELSAQLKAKNFIEEMPISKNGPEPGVTYIVDLLNPETGKNFTSAEVAAIKTDNPEKYQSLLEKCRKISFEAVVKNDQAVVPIQGNTSFSSSEKPRFSENHLEPALENIAKFEHVVLIFDHSPSVDNSYSYMADAIAKQKISGTKINFGTFSNVLDGLKSYDNPAAVAEAIRHIRYNGNVEERTIAATASALETLPAEGKNAVFAMTDEPFQEVSLDNLKKMRAQAGEKTEIYFYYADDRTRTVRQISLDELQAGFEQTVFNRLADRFKLLVSEKENHLNSLKYRRQSYLDEASKLARTGAQASQTDQARVAKLTEEIGEQQIQLETLQADWQSGSVERLFANPLMIERLTAGKPSVKLESDFTCNINGEQLGQVVGQLPAVGK